MLGLGLPALAAWQALKGWSPRALWPTGTEAGMWIDPSNLTSQWQDSTGTTPVSTPGTVADSVNPVGLALDLRLGAPDTLGPELVTNGDFSNGTTGWTLVQGSTVADGKLVFAQSIYSRTIQNISFAAGKTYLVSVTIDSISVGELQVQLQGGASTILSQVMTTSGVHTSRLTAISGTNTFYFTSDVAGSNAVVSNISVKEIPGNHMFQATSTARPLLSAYDGQTLGPGDTYPSTGFPIYQHFDGTDDGMATATFAAGTLINGMDCMIAVRRDSAGLTVLGLYDQNIAYWFGASDATDSTQVCYGVCGTPTVWVDGVQLPGGIAVKRDTLASALPIGQWCILEFRSLDLSGWTAAGFGAYYPGLYFNGGQGGILLFPSSTSTADRDAARTWLGAKVGVTL